MPPVSPRRTTLHPPPAVHDAIVAPGGGTWEQRPRRFGPPKVRPTIPARRPGSHLCCAGRPCTAPCAPPCSWAARWPWWGRDDPRAPLAVVRGGRPAGRRGPALASPGCAQAEASPETLERRDLTVGGTARCVRSPPGAPPSPSSRPVGGGPARLRRGRPVAGHHQPVRSQGRLHGIHRRLPRGDRHPRGVDHQRPGRPRPRHLVHQGDAGRHRGRPVRRHVAPLRHGDLGGGLHDVVAGVHYGRDLRRLRAGGRRLHAPSVPPRQDGPHRGVPRHGRPHRAVQRRARPGDDPPRPGPGADVHDDDRVHLRI